MKHERCDVLIVGAGPAGLAAALELKRSGVNDAIVIEREQEAGGVPRHCHHTGFGIGDLRRVLTGPQYARRYRQQARTAGVEIRTSTTATEWVEPKTLAVTSPQGRSYMEAKAILLATGCRERPRAARLVPGTRPQGIFTTGSLQRFIHEYGQIIGRRAVIVGAELVSLSAALTLRGANIDVAVMVTELPRHQIYFPYSLFKWYFSDLRRLAPVVANARISRIEGKQRVERVEMYDLNSSRCQWVDCDTVIFTGDWVPENSLSRLGSHKIDAGTRGPRVDGGFRTSSEGIFAAGNLLRGAETADIAALEGRLAAQAIRRYLHHGAWHEKVLAFQVASPLDYVYPNMISAADYQVSLTGSQARRSAPPRFTFRAREFCQNVQLRVCQAERVLYRKMFRRIAPNQSFHFDGSWLAAVDLNGEPLRLSTTEQDQK